MDELFDVYAMIRDDGAILGIEGGLTESNIRDFSQWTLIDSGEGRKYSRCQAEYIPGGLFDSDGIPMYKYEGNTVMTRSEAEKTADKVITVEPDAEADLLEMMVDHEYRLILLELGIFDL